MARTNVGAAAKTSPRRVRTTEQTIKALDLRKRGHTYTEIAGKLECARSTACRYVLSELEYLADQCREEAGQVRDLELARLDELYLKAWTALESASALLATSVAPDEHGRDRLTDEKQYMRASRALSDAEGRCLNIMERRAKLLGLDAPAKQELTGKDGGPLRIVTAEDLTDDELAAIVAGASAGRGE